MQLAIHSMLTRLSSAVRPLSRSLQQGFFGRAMDKVSDRFGGFGGSKLGSVTEVRPCHGAAAFEMLPLHAALRCCCSVAAGPTTAGAACRLRHVTSCPSFQSHLLQVGSIEDLDAYYERLGTFTGLYARHIFNRMSKTVPKAIILCQVGAAAAFRERLSTAAQLPTPAACRIRRLVCDPFAVARSLLCSNTSLLPHLSRRRSSARATACWTSCTRTSCRSRTLRSTRCWPRTPPSSSGE